MPPDLWPDREEALHLLARTPAGLFVDIDGTIAPIVSDPAKANVPEPTRRSLAALAARLTVVALTGREVPAARRMVGLDNITYIGNHGVEWWADGRRIIAPEAERFVEQMHATAVAAEGRFRSTPGVLVEDKGPSVSIHYRAADSPERARQEIFEFLSTVETSRGLLLREGKMIVEIRPPLQLDKGTGLRAIVERDGLVAALVLGDDLTDADAFHELRALRASGRMAGLNVAVLHQGRAPEAVLADADFSMEGTDGVDRFLGWLAGRL
ncbi:MAG: trehalose-phosphatase [SAR202 cluster bacterium]|nr:trehalose-phosphatase [SAR202 cluster bacterium]